MTASADEPERVGWTDAEGRLQTARWRSLAGRSPPHSVVLVDDHLSTQTAWRSLNEGTALLWLGDFGNARHLLTALVRRLNRVRAAAPAEDLHEAFERHRTQQARRAELLGGLLLPFDADHGVPLPRAPDVRLAGLEARGAVREHYVASLRELLGLVGAHEWRRRGVPIAALGGRIYPHHGVYSPVRGEYVDLVAEAPLPAAAVQHGAAEIGTGTGVLAAVLARRGLRVWASDLSAAAVACASDNIARLQLADRVTVVQADLYATGVASQRYGLVICNPPWLPGPATSALDAAVYDPESRMLRGFLTGLEAHLCSGGEGWLILSDLAEHLGLRSRDTLLRWIDEAGLRVLGRSDTRPRHRKAADRDDPLHEARRAELTSLWRLGRAAD
ncbi:MAG: class I SAM-dependent methyltransferase [Pseudomonadota bacterium]|nr:class I SAM-dependent methyltransferase [Pseudomonadota bacterium]